MRKGKGYKYVLRTKLLLKYQRQQTVSKVGCKNNSSDTSRIICIESNFDLSNQCVLKTQLKNCI